MKVVAEFTVTTSVPARRLYMGRALPETQEEYVTLRVEADCFFLESTQRFIASQLRVVAHDGPEDFDFDLADLEGYQLKQLIGALSDAHIEASEMDLPYVVTELAS